MVHKLISFLLFTVSTFSLFAQTETKLTSELKLTIYKGNAYKNWYANNHGTTRKIREYEADLSKEKSDLGRRIIQAKLAAVQKQQREGDKKEKKAVALHTLNIPISFVFRKNENEELPWKAQAVVVNHNGIYEDDFFKIEITNIRIENYTSQNYFRFEAKITNKHVLYLNLTNKLVHDILDVEYGLMVNHKEGKFEEVQHSKWANGSVYKNKEPRIYKTDNKLYSFVPFLDRFEEAVFKNLGEIFK